MKIRCTDCSFNEESLAVNSIDILINAKIEHEWTHTDHHVIYTFGLRSKLIKITDPEFVYKSHCKTCAALYLDRVSYMTVSKLDLQRFIENHTKAMKKNDIKHEGIEQIHEFATVSYRYQPYIEGIENKNPVVDRMKTEGITAADLSDATDVKKSSDDISQFMVASASYEELVICKRMTAGLCPVSYCMGKIGEHYSPTVDWYNKFLQHMRDDHRVLDSVFDNKVVSVLQQCLIFIRNIESNYSTLPLADRKKKANKESEALRNLNKMGIPLGMLDHMFHRGVSRIGEYTYRGMKLLGVPDWVKEISNDGQ